MYVVAPSRPARRSSRLALLLVAALTAGSLSVAAQTATAAPVPWEHDISVGLIGLEKNHSPAPTVVDWDGDGRDDLVVGLRSADQYGGIAVALREADGSLGQLQSAFTSGTITSAAGWTLYARPAVADWNNDGALDLIVGSYYSHKGVLVCLSEPTDGVPRIHGEDCRALRTAGGRLVGETTSSNIAYLSPDVVDWDLDGDLDLLVGTGASADQKGVRLYENVGSSIAPTLAAPTEVVSQGATAGLAAEDYYEPTVVDIDDDGRRDLLVAGSRIGTTTRTFQLWTCLNTGSDAAPAFTSCSSAALPGLVNNVVDATDWDKDGYLDLVTGINSGFIANDVTLLHGKAPDSDGDGVSDSVDNCPAVPNAPDLMLDKTNPVQVDTDRDGRGDPCDADDDGDGVHDDVDICPWTSDAGQEDRDGDGRGDSCDARDDRPGHPGKGSYEVQMADRIGWGRKPVIVQRADAMSVGYRQEIAEALTNEALDRGLPFSLAVIPWDAPRFDAARGSEYLNEVIDDPNFEVVQHGTYHSCMYTPYLRLHGSSAAEFNCGMGVAHSVNLMEVGRDALLETVDFERAARPMSGFIPPTDAYDDAAGEAIQAMGYGWVASAWYAETPKFVHVDDSGLLHIPWSQIACGNGAATWTDCQATDRQGLAAHSGVDCDDPAVCMPTKDGKDYSDWERYASASMADRCRNDFERYGVCSVLYELTSYDGNFATGELDPHAFSAYQQTLTELEELADDTGAVFLTLGDYAAALQAEDTVAPTIDLGESTGSYGYDESYTVDVDVADDLSGVHSVTLTLDGEPVEDGQVVDLVDFTLGAHTLTVAAEDVAGNTSTRSATFSVVDEVAPEISIASPTGASYLHHELLSVEFVATDAKSGLVDVVATLDGEAVEDGDVIDLLDLPLGEHTLTVTARDGAGNRSQSTVAFTVVATLGSLRDTVQRYVEEAVITDSGTARSLLRILGAAQDAVDRSQPEVAVRELRAFVNHLSAQSGKKVPSAAAALLITDADVVSENLLGRA